MYTMSVAVMCLLFCTCFWELFIAWVAQQYRARNVRKTLYKMVARLRDCYMLVPQNVIVQLKICGYFSFKIYISVLFYYNLGYSGKEKHGRILDVEKKSVLHSHENTAIPDIQ